MSTNKYVLDMFVCLNPATGRARLATSRQHLTHQFITTCIVTTGAFKSKIDRVNFQKMLTLKANRVNLGHINFLGVLRGAEPKSSVCPAQKCPQMPQN